MAALKSVLQEFDRTMLGGSPEATSKDQLRAGLVLVQKRNERYFIVAVLLLISFFVSSWVLVFLCRQQPNYLVAIFGLLGGSVFGCIWSMTKMWQRKIATDYILAISDVLPTAELKLVVRKLLSRI